jgi:hypothetical protein
MNSRLANLTTKIKSPIPRFLGPHHVKMGPPAWQTPFNCPLRTDPLSVFTRGQSPLARRVDERVTVDSLTIDAPHTRPDRSTQGRPCQTQRMSYGAVFDSSSRRSAWLTLRAAAESLA